MFTVQYPYIISLYIGLQTDENGSKNKLRKGQGNKLTAIWIWIAPWKHFGFSSCFLPSQWSSYVSATITVSLTHFTVGYIYAGWEPLLCSELDWHINAWHFSTNLVSMMTLLYHLFYAKLLDFKLPIQNINSCWTNLLWEPTRKGALFAKGSIHHDWPTWDFAAFWPLESMHICIGLTCQSGSVAHFFMQPTYKCYTGAL